MLWYRGILKNIVLCKKVRWKVWNILSLFCMKYLENIYIDSNEISGRLGLGGCDRGLI